MPIKLEYSNVLEHEYTPKPVTVQRPAIVTRIPSGWFNSGSATLEKAGRTVPGAPAATVIHYGPYGHLSQRLRCAVCETPGHCR